MVSQVLLVTHSGGFGFVLVVRGESGAHAPTILAVTSMANSVESCCLEEIRGAGARPERGADVREKEGKEQKRVTRRW